MYEPIKERNIFVYVFLMPVVVTVVTIIGYVAIFAAALGMEASSYYESYAATAGLGVGSILLGIFLALVMVVAIIYFVVIWTGVSRDVNTMCAGDPQSTPLMAFAGAYCIGAFVPFGFIYLYYYMYKMQNKMQRNAYRYNANVTWSPIAVLLFAIFVPIVAYAFLLISFNELAKAYNESQGMNYTPDENYGEEDSGGLVSEIVEPLHAAGIGASGQGLLRCYAGETAGASIIMNNYDTIVLGRDPQMANLVLKEDKKISRRHCSITFRNGGFYITDHSTNGTRLADGRRLEHGKEISLGSQAEIHLSDTTTFVVRLK